MVFLQQQVASVQLAAPKLNKNMPPPSGQPMEVTQEGERGSFRAVYAALIGQGFGADRSILSTTPAPDPLDVPTPGQQEAMPSVIAVVPKAPHQL